MAILVLIFLLSLLVLQLQSATGGSNQDIGVASFQAQHREEHEWRRTSTSHLLPGNSSCDVSILTSTRSNPGSPLLSFRGEVVSMPVHISDAVAHFKEMNLSYDWIDMLKEIRDLGPISQGSEIHIVYQRVSLPWPVSDRELILERHWQVDSQLKTVNASYYSLEDAAAEAILGSAPPGVVRSVTPLTRWVFSANKDGVSTDITCETTVDSRGSIPAMLVNYIQKGWPTNALKAFYKLVLSKKVAPLDELLLW